MVSSREGVISFCGRVWSRVFLERSQQSRLLRGEEWKSTCPRRVVCPMAKKQATLTLLESCLELSEHETGFVGT
jgi:hypothetical protein